MSLKIHSSGQQPSTVYDIVGGDPWFVALIDDFYDRVENDPVIRPLYPDDLTASRESMVKFLVQYWGGPDDYSQEKGHPRLRMRHAPFVIRQAERNAWLEHMRAAVQAQAAATKVDSAIEEQMLEYFDVGSTHMINTADD